MWAWTDNQGNPEDALTLDEMLDNIMLYWLPGNATSSARLYWESVANVAPTKLANVASTRLELPVGVSIYPRETNRPSRRWVDRWMPNLIHYNILDRGGHFAAGEQPALHAKEIRDCFAINNIPGFWLKNGEVAKDLYVAFTAKSADAVRASYKAAIDAGATSNKEPSLRPEWRADYFAANIGDPDGYNIEIAYKPWLYK